MRNLKKILALVLVLVMAMSFASAASFSDVDANEAIDVMTGIGVIAGYPDGSFKPNKELTREEAMKIIAYLDLTAPIAETLPLDGSFSDVATGRWSAGYIAYACANDIVNGNPDGTFNPTGTLTGYQFAKMILNVLGIKGEYTGLLWISNVNKALLKNPALLTGLEKVDLSAAMTRAQACQMAYNALWIGAKTVENTTYTVSAIEGSEYASYIALLDGKYTSKIDAVKAVKALCDAVLDVDYKVVAKTDSKNVTSELSELHDVKYYEVADDFGIVTSGHCSITPDKKGNPIAVYTATEESYESYQTIAKSALHTLFKDEDVKDSDEVTIPCIVDGVESTLTVVGTDKTGVVGGAGVEVLVCADKVVVKNTYALGQVTKVVDAVADDPKTEADETAKAYVVFDNDTTETNILVTDEYVEGEYVLATKANGEVVEHWAADVVEAKLSKRTSSYIIVEGEKYYVAATVGDLDYGINCYNKEYAYYVCDGVVYDTVNEYTPAEEEKNPEAVAADEFVWVTGAGYTWTYTAGTEANPFAAATEATYSFRAVMTYYGLDGKVAHVELPVTEITEKDDKYPTFSYVNWNGETVKVTMGLGEGETTKTVTDYNSAVNAWAAMVDGEFVKWANVTNAVVKTSAGVAEGNTSIDGIKATKSTTYTVVNPAHPAEGYTLTGTKIVIAEGTKILVETLSNGKVASAVYSMSFAEPDNTPVESSANYAYVIEVGATVGEIYEEDVMVDTVYECVFFINGAQKTINVLGSVTVEAGYVYDLTLTDDVVTKVSEGIKVEATGIVTEIYAGEFFAVDPDAEVKGDEYYVDLHKDCVVYDLVNYDLGELEIGAKVFVAAVKDSAAILIYVVG